MRVGIFAPNLSELGGTEKFTALLAQELLSLGHPVDILSGARMPRGRLERAFSARLPGLRILDMGASLRKNGKEAAAATARYGLFINQASNLSFPSFAARSWLWAHYLPRRAPKFLDHYRIFANSRYTARWIRRRWGRRAELLYGPVNTEDFASAPKEKRFLSVLRLRSRPAPKHELELIRRFVRLREAGRLPGWSYDIAARSGPGDAAWVRRLARAAGRAPVRLHLDPPFCKLAELYSKAAMLWHAAGLGFRESDDPRQLEHFGIVLVEAMAAGCLPLAYGRGGPVEIVKSGKDGFLFRSWEGLERRAASVAAGRLLLTEMRRAARASSRRFGLSAFRKRLGELL